MKNSVVTLFLAIVLVSCQQKISTNDIPKINGYWEIQKVILPGGNKKEYKINETVDYFEIKGNVGFRKKVMPQFDGTYKANDVSEEVQIIQDKDYFFIGYTTVYGKWKEQILEISDSELVLKNEQDLEYHYKKSIPFSLK